MSEDNFDIDLQADQPLVSFEFTGPFACSSNRAFVIHSPLPRVRVRLFIPENSIFPAIDGYFWTGDDKTVNLTGICDIARVVARNRSKFAVDARIEVLDPADDSTLASKYIWFYLSDRQMLPSATDFALKHFLISSSVRRIGMSESFTLPYYISPEEFQGDDKPRSYTVKAYRGIYARQVDFLMNVAAYGLQRLYIKPETILQNLNSEGTLPFKSMDSFSVSVGGREVFFYIVEPKENEISFSFLNEFCQRETFRLPMHVSFSDDVEPVSLEVDRSLVPVDVEFIRTYSAEMVLIPDELLMVLQALRSLDLSIAGQRVVITSAPEIAERESGSEELPSLKFSFRALSGLPIPALEP